MSSLKMAVVGVGALGRHHARILAELEGVELVAVADPNPDIGRAVAERHATRWVPHHGDLPGDVQAVAVVVPTTAHLAVAADFLRQGMPVLVEKPLAATVDEAEQLVGLAERHGALLQVGHVERFNPATQAAWNLCGDPKYIRAERVSPYAFRSTDIGAVHDLMIHDLDLVLSLVKAPIRRVEAFGICILGGHEDSVQARIVFENGCLADLTASRVSPAARRSMQIWSATGTTTVDFTSREVVHYRPSKTLLYGTPPAERAAQPGADLEQLKQSVFGMFIEVARPPVPAADALTAELASFVECARHGHRPVVGGPEALQAMIAAERVLQSVASHQWNGHAAGPVGPFARPAVRSRKMAG